jgi:hypothetical protein
MGADKRKLQNVLKNVKSFWVYHASGTWATESFYYTKLSVLEDCVGNMLNIAT